LPVKVELPKAEKLKLYAHIAADKKNMNGELNLIIAKDFGDCVIMKYDRDKFIEKLVELS
jgi:3-dehydroquinate synthetase